MTPVTYQIYLIAQSLWAVFLNFLLFSAYLAAFHAESIAKMTPVTYSRAMHQFSVE